MKHIHMRSRLAPVMLLVVLFVLVSCSIGATIIIWAASTQAAEASHMNDLYQQASILAHTEDSSVKEYSLNPSEAIRREYHSTASALVSVLHTIHQQGDASDRAFVDLLLQ